MRVESQVETARRAVVGTSQQAAQLAAGAATGAWEQAQDLVGQGVELVEADVVVPLGRRARRLKSKIAPPPKRRGPSPLMWALLAVAAVVVGAAIMRRKRVGRLEVDRAGALVGEPPPDAFGAAVIASEASAP